MANANIKQLFVETQVVTSISTKDGNEMHGKAFTLFIHSLIREYATYTEDGYSLFVCDLPIIEKKLLLSHILSAEDYEDFTQNSVRLEAACKEFDKDMQYFINLELDNVYHETMNEMGKHFRRASNGDVYYD